MASPNEAQEAAGVDVVGRHGRLFARTLLVSALTLVSRVVGFARETIAASIFGDRSPINDAFVTAWRVPNLFRSMLGEGAISTAMQAELTRTDAGQGIAAGNALFRSLFRSLALFLVAACAVLMLVVWVLPDRMPLTGIAWLGEHPGPVRELLVRMLPFVVLVCLSAVAAGALNVRGHFLAPAAGPAIMNVAWIGALFLVAHRFGWASLGPATEPAEMERHLAMSRELAFFVVAAGVLLLAVQVPALVKHGFLRDETRGERASWKDALRIVRTSAPLALGAAVYQVNVLVDGFMAESMLESGGPSLLYWAQRLQQLPLSLVAVAATSAVFPVLTAFGQTGRKTELRELLDETSHAIAFLAVPAACGLFVLAAPIVAVCFQRGAFGVEGVERTASALRGLALALPAIGAAGLLARAYYALGDFRTPVLIGLWMLVLNVALNWTLVRALDMDVGGLALATAVVAWTNLTLLAVRLRRLGMPPARNGGAWRLVRVLGASLAATGLARSAFELAREPVGRTMALAIAISLAAGVYAAIAAWLSIPEWGRTLARLRKVEPSSR